MALKENKACWFFSIKFKSQIARVLDDESFVPAASLDLSAVFDLVKTDLLLLRPK
jgi:hypothetical protein